MRHWQLRHAMALMQTKRITTRNPVTRGLCGTEAGPSGGGRLESSCQQIRTSARFSTTLPGTARSDQSVPHRISLRPPRVSSDISRHRLALTGFPRSRIMPQGTA